MTEDELKKESKKYLKVLMNYKNVRHSFSALCAVVVTLLLMKTDDLNKQDKKLIIEKFMDVLKSRLDEIL